MGKEIATQMNNRVVVLKKYNPSGVKSALVINAVRSSLPSLFQKG